MYRLPPIDGLARPSAPGRLLRAAGVALAAAACVSCGSGGVSAAQTDPTVLVHDVEGRTDDAGIDGYVRYLADVDCFVLEPTADGKDGVRNVAVWPPGTKVWGYGSEVKGVVVPDHDPIAVGSRVSGGGGYANPDTSDVDLPDVSADCVRSGGEFAMLHVISAVTPP